jgi:hypothetical protein
VLFPLVLQDGTPLAAPLCVAYFLIVGMRFAFELPAGQAAAPRELQTLNITGS